MILCYVAMVGGISLLGGSVSYFEEFRMDGGMLRDVVIDYSSSFYARIMVAPFMQRKVAVACGHLIGSCIGKQDHVLENLLMNMG